MAANRNGIVVRAMVETDLAAAASISAQAFGIEIDDERAAGRWRQRVRHLLVTDPDGAFMAERDGQVIGVAQAMLRERLWCLSLLAVAQSAQGSGAGGALLERTLHYARAADAGLIVSSNDPRALAIYVASGFSLRPALKAAGPVDRGALPPADRRVRAAGSADLEALEPISRAIRGASHTIEIRYALGRGAALLRLADRGFAVAQPGHGVWLLVARDEEAAGLLLWSALELAGDGERPLGWITAGQDWAVSIAVAAGLRLSGYGALGVWGDPGPLRPYLPSAPFA